jgi:hypothetical protein
MVPLGDVGDKVTEADFAFICDRHSNPDPYKAMLIPFDGTYDNQQGEVSVLVEKGKDQNSNLLQKWQNGYKYLFLTQKDKVTELMDYLKNAEASNINTVTLFFSGDFHGRLEKLNYITLDLSGFSGGLVALHAACQSN